MEEPPRNLQDVQFALDPATGIATITLDRPHRLNALSEGMAESLLKLCDYLAAAPADKVRVCVLHGGARAFSTGRDLKDSKLHTTLAQRERYMKLALDSVLAVNRLPLPTVAAMSGPAFGWGLELALGCDLRVVAPQATLCLPETSLGIFPGAGGVVLLRELVSPAIAKDLIYTARRFSGQEALALGVVNGVAEDALGEALGLAKRIAANGPLGVRGAKEVIEGTHNVDFTTAMRLASQLRAPLSETDDFREALQAFEEKRKPVFKGQ